MNAANSAAFLANRFRWVALVVGILGSVLAIVGLFASGARQFYQSYLFAFVFWIGLTLGSLALVMLFYVAGGKWARTVQGITASGARTILLMVLLFIPIPFGLSYIYPWAQSATVAGDEILQHQSSYLNPTLFVVRAVVFFAIWILLAYGITRLTARPDSASNPELFYRLRRFSTIGIILYFLTMSFASFDWILSLQQDWYSSIFGLIIILSQGLTSLAFAVIILRLLLRSQYQDARDTDTRIQINRDLGAVLLAFTVGWAYMSFFQYLIIWAGNIAQEVTWYFIRLNNGWQAVALIVVIAQFALPFFALISLQTRSRLSVLSMIAAVIFFVNWITLFWQIAPAVYPEGIHLHWLDFLLPIAMGGFWLFVFLGELKNRSSIPQLAPQLPEKSIGEMEQ